MAVAYCWRSGVIEIGRSLPANAVKLGTAHGNRLNKAVSACARHAYDGQTLLVPGIPEAASEFEAFKAARHFADQLARRLERRKRRAELL